MDADELPSADDVVEISSSDDDDDARDVIDYDYDYDYDGRVPHDYDSDSYDDSYDSHDSIDRDDWPAVSTSPSDEALRGAIDDDDDDDAPGTSRFAAPSSREPPARARTGRHPRPPPRPDAAARAAAGLGPPPPPADLPEYELFTNVRVTVRNDGNDGGGGRYARIGQRGKRARGERTHRAGVERFNRALLSWPVDGLAMDDPSAAGVAPLPPPATTYRDRDEYYDFHAALATEEARAALADALARGRSGRRGGNARVRVRIGKGKGGDGLFACEAFELGGRGGRGGGRGRGGGWRGRGGGGGGRDGSHRGGGGGGGERDVYKEDDWRRPGTVVVVRTPTSTPRLAIVPATTARDRDAAAAKAAAKASSNAGGATEGAAVVLWTSVGIPDGDAELEVLDSVISQQRMAAAAFTRPAVPFLSLLLGTKPATHTKFDSASEEEEEEEEEEEAADAEADAGGANDEDEFAPNTRVGRLGGLNKSQRRAGLRFIAANRKALASDGGGGGADSDSEYAAAAASTSTARGALQLVQGPPGCGKTRFIAALLRDLCDPPKKNKKKKKSSSAAAAADATFSSKVEAIFASSKPIAHPSFEHDAEGPGHASGSCLRSVKRLKSDNAFIAAVENARGVADVGRVLAAAHRWCVDHDAHDLIAYVRNRVERILVRVKEEHGGGARFSVQVFEYAVLCAFAFRGEYKKKRALATRIVTLLSEYLTEDEDAWNDENVDHDDFNRDESRSALRSSLAELGYDWRENEGRASTRVTRPNESNASRRPLRVMVCAPSNKAVTVALEQYLAAGRDDDDDGDGDGDDRPPPPVLVGVEEKLRVASAETASATGGLVMEYFVYQRAAVLAARLRAAIERCGFSAARPGGGPARPPGRGGRERSDAKNDPMLALKALAKRTTKELKASAPRFLKTGSPGLLAALALAASADASAEQTRSAAANAAKRLMLGSGRNEHADAFASEVISTATLTFCTLSSAGQAMMTHAKPPDALVVDEAAAALEAETIVAFSRRPARCLLVGDPAQLPATMSSEVARRAGHDRSLMQRLVDAANAAAADATAAGAGAGAGAGGSGVGRVASSNASSIAKASWYTLLDTQYRMHPDISAFPSARFYDGEVKDAASVSAAPRFLALATTEPRPRWIASSFVFVDVSSGTEDGGGGSSLGNHAEAELAAALAVLLPSCAHSAARRETETSSASASAVISFYSEQVRRVKIELAKLHRGGQHPAAGVKTGAHSVDSFQGSEADVVVVSAVRRNDCGAVGFLDDRRRLNVALTRAKRLCVFVGCAATLEKSAKDGKPCADLRALVENARARGALVSEREVRAWIAAARERRGRVPAPSAPPTRKRKRSPTPPRSTVIATATPPVVKPADRTLEGWGNVNPKSLAERLKSPGRDGNAVNWVEHFKTAGRRGLR